MPATDTKLAGALKQAKAGPMNFAFVAKGAADGQLLVNKTRVPAKDVATAKSDLGGGTIWRGRCFGENGLLVFEVPKEPPGTLAKQLKTIIQRDAGQTLKVEVRVVPGLDNEEEAPEGAAGAPAGAPPMPDAGADFKDRFKALMPPIKQLQAAGSPAAGDVMKSVAQAGAFAQKKDWSSAHAVLDQLETQVNALVAPPTPPAPPPVPPPARQNVAEEKLGPDGVKFKARLKILMPDLVKAQTGVSPLALQVKAKAAVMQDWYKKKDFAHANTALDELEPLIKQALAARETPAPPAAKLQEGGSPSGDAATEALNENALRAEWERRVIAIEPRILEAKKTRPSEAKWMTLFMSVQDTGEAGDYARAIKILDNLDGLLNAAPKAAAGGPDDKSFVAMQTARLRWDQTRKKVGGDLKALEKAIVGRCTAFNNVPTAAYTIDLGDLKAKSQTLFTILEKLDERLIDKLDEALNAQARELRQQKQGEAVALIKEYQAIVNSDPLINAIDGNGFAATSIKQTFATVLGELSGTLQ